MERSTVELYDRRGLEWAASHAKAGQRHQAERFAHDVGATKVRIDVGCGAGRYLSHLGTRPSPSMPRRSCSTPAVDRFRAPSTCGGTRSTSPLPGSRSTVHGPG